VTGNLAKTTGGRTIAARVTGITQSPCGGGVQIMDGGNTLGATTTTIITTMIIITVEYNILRPREPLLSRRLFIYKPHGPHTKNNMPRAPYNTYIIFFNGFLRLNCFSYNGSEVYLIVNHHSPVNLHL